jgi:hypothetical protein
MDGTAMAQGSEYKFFPENLENLREWRGRWKSMLQQTDYFSVPKIVPFLSENL